MNEGAVTPLTISGVSAASRAFWAKTSRDDPSQWLSLAQHMADSAGAAQVLWDDWASPALRRRIGELTGLPQAQARQLLAWLAGVHDAGKASLTFQTQLDRRGDLERAAFVERLRDAGLPLRMGPVERSLPAFPHSLASRIILHRWLVGEGMSSRRATALCGVVDAHHGLPSDRILRAEAAASLTEYGTEWTGAQKELLDLIADQTAVRPVLAALNRTIKADAQQLLTGLVIMADWIASNQELFPLIHDQDPDQRLRDGLDLDFTAPWRAEPLELPAIDSRLRHRFSWPEERLARPVQRVAAEAASDDPSPYLMIIEAPTGEGKTEAALLVAEILAARHGSGGVIVAAPTMATADGLFQRVLSWAERASAEGAVTSMFLGHSKSRLNRAYSELRKSARAATGTDKHGIGSVGLDEEQMRADLGGTAAREGHGSVVASQWMSGRRKGILSNFTVATVDQILFMALQSRHSMLRHVGLANKVVIIDEVHAYDAYMSSYLATALMWLARYRVPVVLLSATLPLAQKRKMLNATRSEFSNEPLGDLSDGYPLITSVSAQGVSAVAVEPRTADLRARLSLIPDELDDLTSRLADALSEGGCVLVIANTVRRAQETFERLSAAWTDEVELHHAAFMASARAAKEEALRRELGPSSHRGAGRPHRRIIVATQVAEQSLDIDVDLLVTDIAPMDLLIQRIGRLHRHARPDSDRPPGLREPQVWVRGVLDETTPAFDRGAEAIYGTRMLLASLSLLTSRLIPQGFTRPDDVPELVQAAYSETIPGLPVAWAGAWSEAVAASESRRQDAEARASTFRLPAPASAASIDDLFRQQESNIDTARGEAQGLAQVRDSDPSVEVIPILVSAEGYKPLLPPGECGAALVHDAEPPASIAFALAASTVRLPNRMTRYASAFDRVVTQLELETPSGWRSSSWLQGCLALPLAEESATTRLNGHLLRYTAELGLHELTEESHHTHTTEERRHHD